MTQRKKATHFALMDSAFTADRKFIRLATRATIPIEYAAAVGVYWLLLADCRRSKSPVIDWEDYAEYAPQIELLKSVGLLDDDGFPPDPFEKWAPRYKSPADARRTGTQGNDGVRNGTQGNPTSIQLGSSQFPSEGGAGGSEQGLWGGKGSHYGQHPDCGVCHPEKLRAVK